MPQLITRSELMYILGQRTLGRDLRRRREKHLMLVSMLRREEEELAREHREGHLLPGATSTGGRASGASGGASGGATTTATPGGRAAASRLRREEEGAARLERIRQREERIAHMRALLARLDADLHNPATHTEAVMDHSHWEFSYTEYLEVLVRIALFAFSKPALVRANLALHPTPVGARGLARSAGGSGSDTMLAVVSPTMAAAITAGSARVATSPSPPPTLTPASNFGAAGRDAAAQTPEHKVLRLLRYMKLDNPYATAARIRTVGAATQQYLNAPTKDSEWDRLRWYGNASNNLSPAAALTSLLAATSAAEARGEAGTLLAAAASGGGGSSSGAGGSPGPDIAARRSHTHVKTTARTTAVAADTTGGGAGATIGASGDVSGAHAGQWVRDDNGVGIDTRYMMRQRRELRAAATSRHAGSTSARRGPSSSPRSTGGAAPDAAAAGADGGVRALEEAGGPTSAAAGAAGAAGGSPRASGGSSVRFAATSPRAAAGATEGGSAEAEESATGEAPEEAVVTQFSPGLLTLVRRYEYDTVSPVFKDYGAAFVDCGTLLARTSSASGAEAADWDDAPQPFRYRLTITNECTDVLAVVVQPVGLPPSQFGVSVVHSSRRGVSLAPPASGAHAPHHRASGGEGAPTGASRARAALKARWHKAGMEATLDDMSGGVMATDVAPGLSLVIELQVTPESGATTASEVLGAVEVLATSVAGEQEHLVVPVYAAFVASAARAQPPTTEVAALRRASVAAEAAVAAAAAAAAAAHPPILAIPSEVSPPRPPLSPTASMGGRGIAPVVRRGDSLRVLATGGFIRPNAAATNAITQTELRATAASLRSPGGRSPASGGPAPGFRRSAADKAAAAAEAAAARTGRAPWDPALGGTAYDGTARTRRAGAKLVDDGGSDEEGGDRVGALRAGSGVGSAGADAGQVYHRGDALAPHHNFTATLEGAMVAEAEAAASPSRRSLRREDWHALADSHRGRLEAAAAAMPDLVPSTRYFVAGDGVWGSRGAARLTSPTSGGAGDVRGLGDTSPTGATDGGQSPSRARPAMYARAAPSVPVRPASGAAATASPRRRGPLGASLDPIATAARAIGAEDDALAAYVAAALDRVSIALPPAYRAHELVTPDTATLLASSSPAALSFAFPA